jgi:hypothetical protein
MRRGAPSRRTCRTPRGQAPVQGYSSDAQSGGNQRRRKQRHPCRKHQRLSGNQNPPPTPDDVRPVHCPLGGFEVTAGHEQHRGDAHRQHGPQAERVLDPEQRATIEQHVADRASPKAARPPTTQIPTASRRLRAASITPESANAMVAAARQPSRRAGSKSWSGL